VRRMFASAEARFSRFLDDSELSRVNADPAEHVELSAPFATVLGCAADLFERTGGLVDPAVGNRVIDWGYDRTFGELPELVAAPLGAPGDMGWSLDGRTLHRAPGTRFDFGGIVKGWTADEAVQAGLANVVSAGGDLRSRDSATIVDIVDPWGESAARLTLGTGGLATSSIGRRRWISAGGPAHHIIDPRTGDPAITPVVSASVVAETAAEAEAGAKAVLILGAEGLAWAALQPWIRSAVAIWTDGNVYATPGVEVAA